MFCRRINLPSILLFAFVAQVVLSETEYDVAESSTTLGGTTWLLSRNGATVTVSTAGRDDTFQFLDVGRTPDPEKYKNVPNPPVYVSPLGACEVPNLSLKTVKKELSKRLMECTDCATKRDYQDVLRDGINAIRPVMSDVDVERFQKWAAPTQHPSDRAEL